MPMLLDAPQAKPLSCALDFKQVKGSNNKMKAVMSFFMAFSLFMGLRLKVVIYVYFLKYSLV